jgi:hypothetical protein
MAMSKGKALGLDGIVIEFYVKNIYHIIGEDYGNMIKNFIQVKRLFIGAIKGLTTLICKFRDKEHMGNWCPISFLNLTYKIFAKMLQLGL